MMVTATKGDLAVGDTSVGLGPIWQTHASLPTRGCRPPRFGLVIPRPKQPFPSQHTLLHLNGYFKTSFTLQVIQES